MGTPELIAVATFLIVALIVVGPYLLLVVRPEASTQEMLRQRIRTGGAAQSRRMASAGGLLKEVERLSVIGPLNKALAGSNAIAANLRDVVHMSGLKLTPGQIVLGSGCLALVGYILIRLWAPSVWLGLAGGLVLGFLPYITLRVLRARRLNLFEEQFPEAVDLIARTLRAGHAFTTGLRMAADELPQPVAAEFKLLHDQQNYGLPMPDAMRAFARRVPLIDSQFFATAVLTQREAGGNLAEVLDNLSAVIRERFKIKRQLRVVSAHGRLTGLVLGLLPPSLGLFMMIRSPDHFTVLVNDPVGVRMLAAAVFLQIFGVYLIYKITKVEYEAVPFQLLITLVVVFLSAGLLVAVASSFVLTRLLPGRRRLSAMSQPKVTSGVVAVEEAVLADAPDPEWNRLVNMLPTSRVSVTRLRREMAMAGFETARSAALLSLAELVFPLLLVLPPLFLLTGMNRWVVAGLGALIGYMGPGFLLSRRIKSRQKQIENGLADALDLLVLCLEAGSSLDQAVVKASEELSVSYPALGDQLHILISETRAGKPRLDAFRGLADRTRVDDVRALVAMLIQTDKFGTSISQALRSHAGVCRTKRRQRAEERAQKVGVKLVFPLVFCLFPALYVVMLGPAYIQLMNVFGEGK